MADLQTSAFLATVDPTLWTNPAEGFEQFVFSPSGDEVWCHFTHDEVSNVFAPRLVRLAWPALTVVDDFALDWGSGYQAGLGGGWSFAASGADKVMVARRRFDTATITYDIDEWTLSTGTYTTVAQFLGSPPIGPAASAGSWFCVAIEWNTATDTGYAVMGGNSLYLYKIERSGTVTQLDGAYVLLEGGQSDTKSVLAPNSDFSEVHFAFYDQDDVAVWRAAYLTTATGVVTKGTATKDFVIRPGLAHVGAEPLAKGVHYYDPSTSTGYDLGDIEDPGTGTQRTGALSTMFVADGHMARTNEAHTIGGFVKPVSAALTFDWYEFLPEYVPPVTRRPTVGRISFR